MIRALVIGRLYGSPQSRTSAAGKLRAAAAWSRDLGTLEIGGTFSTDFDGLPTVASYRFRASSAKCGSISNAIAIFCPLSR
ncbi:MAG: hypothetical protein IPK83_24925 [Planctomycetes bacterium]|nr:hypothetical protein [Planctomycetota bacterium]